MLKILQNIISVVLCIVFSLSCMGHIVLHHWFDALFDFVFFSYVGINFYLNFKTNELLANIYGWMTGIVFLMFSIYMLKHHSGLFFLIVGMFAALIALLIFVHKTLMMCSETYRNLDCCNSKKDEV